VPLAFVAARLIGRGDTPAFQEPQEEEDSREDYALLLRDTPPAIHRLMGDRDQRLTALSELARKGDANSIATLRWIIERGESEAVVDAALTLEQLSETGLSEITTFQRLLEDAEEDELIRFGDHVLQMMESGLADAPLVPRLASFVRQFYEKAEESAGHLSLELALRWSRLELRAIRPDAAVALLERTRAPKNEDESTRLGKALADARFAARQSR
jgi:hypothetical protein